MSLPAYLFLYDENGMQIMFARFSFELTGITYSADGASF